MLQKNSQRTRFVVLGAKSGAQHIDPDSIAIIDKQSGREDIEVYFIPDFWLWNKLTRFPLTFRWLMRSNLKNLESLISSFEDNYFLGLLVHKESALEPMIAIGSYLIERNIVSASNIRIILNLQSGKRVSTVLLNRICHRHELPTSLVADSYFENRNSPFKELIRLSKQ